MAMYRDPYDTTSPQPTGYAPRQQAVQPPRLPNTYGAPRPPQYPTTSQTPYGQAGYQAPRFPGFRPTNEFAADPTTRNLEQLANFQIPYYMQPVQQTNYLAQTGGQYGNLLNAINQVQGLAFSGPSPGESMLLSLASRAGGGNVDAQAEEYRRYLNNEPFTGAEAEAYKTEFTDPLQSQEDQAVQVALAEIARQGIDPNSGIAQAKLTEVRNQFRQAKAQAQNQFAITANQLRAQRQGQRFQTSLSAEELKQRGLSAAMSGASGAAGAWANRLGMGLDAANLGNTAAMQRAAMGYSTDAALRDEQFRNFGRAWDIGNYMSNLPSLRMAEASQFLNGEDPAAVVGMYGGLAAQRQNQARFEQGTYDALGRGLGTIAGYFAPQGGASPAYNDPGFTTNYLPFPVGQTPYVPETYPGSAPWTAGRYYPGG